MGNLISINVEPGDMGAPGSMPRYEFEAFLRDYRPDYLFCLITDMNLAGDQFQWGLKQRQHVEKEVIFRWFDPFGEHSSHNVSFDNNFWMHHNPSQIRQWAASRLGAMREPKTRHVIGTNEPSHDRTMRNGIKDMLKRHQEYAEVLADLGIKSTFGEFSMMKTLDPNYGATGGWSDVHEGLWDDVIRFWWDYRKMVMPSFHLYTYGHMVAPLTNHREQMVNPYILRDKSRWPTNPALDPWHLFRHKRLVDRAVAMNKPFKYLVTEWGLDTMADIKTSQMEHGGQIGPWMEARYGLPEFINTLRGPFTYKKWYEREFLGRDCSWDEYCGELYESSMHVAKLYDEHCEGLFWFAANNDWWLGRSAGSGQGFDFSRNEARGYLVRLKEHPLVRGDEMIEIGELKPKFIRSKFTIGVKVRRDPDITSDTNVVGLVPYSGVEAMVYEPDPLVKHSIYSWVYVVFQTKDGTEVKGWTAQHIVSSGEVYVYIEARDETPEQPEEPEVPEQPEEPETPEEPEPEPVPDLPMYGIEMATHIFEMTPVQRAITAYTNIEFGLRVLNINFHHLSPVQAIEALRDAAQKNEAAILAQGQEAEARNPMPKVMEAPK